MDSRRRWRTCSGDSSAFSFPAHGRPRMEDVPSRALHAASSCARIVVAETVNGDVPRRAIMLDQKTLRQGDPNRHHDEIPASEVARFEVLRLLDALGVLIQPAEEFAAARRFGSSLSGSRPYGLAHIDGHGRICPGQMGIRFEVATIEDGVHTGPIKGSCRGQRMLMPAHERFDNTPGQVLVVQRVVRLHCSAPTA